jgi:hypothetical protein
MVVAALEAMTDDNQLGAWALGALAAFRNARSGLSRPVILRHRLERMQEIPPLGGDLPTVAIPKHVAAGENIDCLNPSGETPHPRVPLGAARGENGNVSLE